MYPVTEKFLTAIESEALLHIRGTIRSVSGAVIELDDSTLKGSPRVEMQCVADKETFNIGGMYIGIAEVNVILPGVRQNELFGGELRLETGVTTEDGIEWIPMGVWDISSAERTTGDEITIRGDDRLSRLKATLEREVGVVILGKLLNHISEIAGVEFAQTAEEIAAIAGLFPEDIRAITTAQTCWEAVRMIAQFIGGFAFANREGEIEFRRFSDVPCQTIGADHRFSLRLSEYDFGIKAVTFSDAFGKTYTKDVPGEPAASTMTLNISNNLFMLETKDDSYITWYDKWVTPAVNALTGLKWLPGTAQYRGNPALDPGDLVMLTGGINGEESGKFLIGSITWQFRAPQTLISPGASINGEAVGGESFSSGSSGSSGVTLNISKNIARIDLETISGEIGQDSPGIAFGNFFCKSETAAFLQFEAVLQGIEASVVKLSAYFDEVAQIPESLSTIAQGEYRTVSLAVPLDTAAGAHKVVIGAKGDAEIIEISAYVWGQDISPELPEMTDSGDYKFTVSGGNTTVTEYVGSSLSPSIPKILGGGKTQIIGKNAFTGSAVNYVRIPEGVTEIQ